MSVFPKTRAAAGYIAGTGPGELARARATILLARLGACEDILPPTARTGARRPAPGRHLTARQAWPIRGRLRRRAARWRAARLLPSMPRPGLRR